MEREVTNEERQLRNLLLAIGELRPALAQMSPQTQEYICDALEDAENARWNALYVAIGERSAQHTEG